MLDDSLNSKALVRAGLVPYVTSWSGERPTRTPLVAKGRSGIAYGRERPGDRDAHGVRWQRYVSAPGVGEPQFSSVHPQRQRHAMRRLLCQVCGEAADRDERGILWLMGEPERGWTGEQLTGQPPVCLRCARTASRVCPHLCKGLLAMRVRHAPIAGVFGSLYRPGRDALFFLGPASLGYDDP
jgi:hypothetical protein